jgi:hypothetical protein
MYRTSAREYPAKLSEVAYPQAFKVRQVKKNGDFKWQGKELYLSGALAGEQVGLKEIDDGIWKIYFSFYPVGILDERTFRIASC